jgi:undecaprenyl diphosphate synthase
MTSEFKIRQEQISANGGLPRHIAIIMDGNGRWAKQQGKPRLQGHYQGALAVKNIVRTCSDLGVSVLSLYAFSEENWGRPQKEVMHIFSLFNIFIRREIADLKKQNIRLNFIGSIDKLPKETYDIIKESYDFLKANTGLILNIALSYGARFEITKTCRKLVEQVVSGSLSVEDISEEVFAKNLCTATLGDPDLLIRTSGEKRISNFLLWESAYAELYFLDIFWPDFNKDHLLDAIVCYQSRTRRYGCIEKNNYKGV